MKDKQTYYSILAGTAEHKDTITFNKQILLIKKRFRENPCASVNPIRIFRLGYARGVLKKYIGERVVRVSWSVLYKAMHKGDKSHILFIDDFINLPDNLNSPVAIFKSKTSGIVVLTKITNYKRKPIIIPLRLVRKGGFAEIKSLYSRVNDNTYKEWIAQGLRIYPKIKK